MKIKNILTLLFPTFIMVMILVVSFSKMDNYNYSGIDYDGIVILSLLFLFPLLFLLQGIFSAISSTNVHLSLGVSIKCFIILMMVYLNDSAALYILIYLAIGVLGYTSTKFILKFKRAEIK